MVFGWFIIKRGGRREQITGLHAHASTNSIGVCDWVIVATKATANLQLPDLIRPLIGEHTQLLTLQNGMGNVESLARAFGSDRTVLAGLCFTCINRNCTPCHRKPFAWLCTVWRIGPVSFRG